MLKVVMFFSRICAVRAREKAPGLCSTFGTKNCGISVVLVLTTVGALHYTCYHMSMESTT